MKKLYSIAATIVVLAEDKNDAIDLADTVTHNYNCPFVILTNSVEEIANPEEAPEGWSYRMPVEDVVDGKVQYADFDVQDMDQHILKEEGAAIARTIQRLMEEVKELKKQLKKK